MFFAALLIMIFPEVSHAYLDAGSGSYIIQIVVAGLVGGVFLIKTFWDKLKMVTINIFFFFKKSPKNKSKNAKVKK